MKLTRNRNGKRLHLIALLLGIYGAFLGFGLILAGLDDWGETIGTIRLLLGLGMVGLGLFGIWDGIRDVIRPPAKHEHKPPTQYILTDVSGNRTSNVTAEMIRDEMGKLREGERNSFHLELLTPQDVPKWGVLKQVSCTARPTLALLAFFQTPEDGWKVCTRVMAPDAAAEWFRGLLEDPAGFSGWDDGWEAQEATPTGAQEAEDEENPSYQTRILRDQAGAYAVWHQRLIIVGKAWRNELKFFTARDVKLAAQGVFEGKYQYARLEWGSSSFALIPGAEDELQVIWCTNIWSDKTRRFFRKAGTVTQVNFWLIQYLNEGYVDEYWIEIAGPAKK